MTARSHTRNRRSEKRHRTRRLADHLRHREARADRRRTIALRRASAWPGPHPAPDDPDSPTGPALPPGLPRPERAGVGRGSIARGSAPGVPS